MAGLLLVDWFAGARSALGVALFLEGSPSVRSNGRLPSFGGRAPCTAGTDGLDGAVVCEVPASQPWPPPATAACGSSVGSLAGFAAAGAGGARHCVWPCCMWPLAFFFLSTRASIVLAIWSACRRTASERVEKDETGVLRAGRSAVYALVTYDRRRLESNMSLAAGKDRHRLRQQLQGTSQHTALERLPRRDTAPVSGSQQVVLIRRCGSRP